MFDTKHPSTLKMEVLTIFGLVLLQTLVEVWSKLWAKHPDHLVTGHLAEIRAIHGAVG